MESIIKDIRYGMRRLLSQPGFTLVAVLTLALGIGANTALFSVVDAVLLKTLPVKDPRQLVLFEYRAGLPFRISGMSGTSFVSTDPTTQMDSLFRYEVFDRMRQAQTSNADSPLSDLFAFGPVEELNAVIGDQAKIINGQVVSGGYYQGLGVPSFLGRTIIEADDKAGAPLVAVLSHHFWLEQFGGNREVVGQSLKLNQQSFTIIGVTPPAFTGTLQVDYRPDVTMAIASEPSLLGDNSNLSRGNRGGRWWLDVMGRLRTGATYEQARVSLDTAFQTAALELMPPPRRADQPAKLDPKDYPHLMAESGSHGMLDERRMYAPTIYGLFVVVALVLLIACANLANLLLARAASRRGEISVRLAVGAGRWRLIRQLLTESVLLAALGGAVGVVFALWGNSVLQALTDKYTGLVPSNVDLNVNWRVLTFTLAVSLLTGVLFGLAPAWRATNLDLTTSLKQSRRTTGAVSRLSKGLIVAQVALSLLLLATAGLYLRSLYNLHRVNVGFNQENLLVFKLQPEQGGYKDERLAQFYQQLFAKLDNLRGVRAATFGYVPLIARENSTSGILLPGEVEATASRHVAARQMVRENYFAAMEIPFLHGRAFTQQDDTHAPEVGIVNQTFAREFFANQDVLGKQLGFRGSKRMVEIVGVVADAKYRSQRDKIPPLLYTPWQQELPVIGEMYFSVRTTGEPTALATSVRETVRDLDRNLPITEVSSQMERSRVTLGPERLSARLFSFFGGLAVLLAALGLSGVLAHSVAQRTNEIGIRMALGARSANVLRLVIWQGMKLVLLGVALGAGAGYVLARVMATQYFAGGIWQKMAEQLYGVQGTVPETFGMIAAFLGAIALIACWLPARRAARVDPIVALRYE
jgi:predicted permease